MLHKVDIFVSFVINNGYICTYAIVYTPHLRFRNDSLLSSLRWWGGGGGSFAPLWKELGLGVCHVYSPPQKKETMGQ
jgi:hypothetical protein